LRIALRVALRGHPARLFLVLVEAAEHACVVEAGTGDALLCWLVFWRGGGNGVEVIRGRWGGTLVMEEGGMGGDGGE
jgi:hypothetical protein